MVATGEIVVGSGEVVVGFGENVVGYGENVVGFGEIAFLLEEFFWEQEWELFGRFNVRFTTTSFTFSSFRHFRSPPEE